MRTDKHFHPRKTLWRASAALSALILTGPGTGPALAGTFAATKTGLEAHPDSGPARTVRLEVLGESLIRVVKTDDGPVDTVPELMTVASPMTKGFSVTPQLGSKAVRLSTPQAWAEVDLTTGAVKLGHVGEAARLTEMVDEAHSRISKITEGGKTFRKVRQAFNQGTGEALYGLGQHQNAQMNLNGEDVVLQQHNMDVAVPLLVSDRHYGILWDNNGITRFGDPKPYGHMPRDLNLSDEAGHSGGLTARYYVGDKLVLTRKEADIDYAFLKDVAENWPAELKGAKDVKVVWDGFVQSPKSGIHKFQLYSSGYARLSLDGQVIKDVWRQNWNPWYHNFDLAMQAGKPVKFHLEWTPEDGMITLTHNDPLPAPDRHAISFDSDIAAGINYVYIDAASIDGVIDGYRRLTGQATLMPKWAFGFWQSRQRYETEDQLLGVLKTYRDMKIPLDNIVQDWFYWPEDQWGSHDFDKTRFPDPKGMVDKVHASHAHIMISIWGKFYANTDNYKEFERKGYMWTQNVKNGTRDWVGPGYLNSHYDPYTPEARAIYYRQLKDRLIPLGFDAWWMDNTEPDVHSNERLEDFKAMIGPTIYGPGSVTFNTYALMNTTAMMDGLRADQPDRRQFILTRSGFAGLQRNSAAIWSGDVPSRWEALYDQITAGQQIGLSGIPYWSHDIGGYAQESRYQGEDAGAAQENRAAGATYIKPEDLAEWRELNLRWFQFGAFSPIFRSHGEVVKREIFLISPEDSDMREAMVWYDKLRYRLMPYIYATAADTYFASGTIMRAPIMDFGNDPKVRDLKDEYLFGHALLVAPVTTYKARARKVYLPAGADWYNLSTGEKLPGGREVTIDAPATRMPVLARAGSIIPLGPVSQYVDEKPDAPLTLTVFTGANGQFSLYEDDGVSNGYARGEYSRIPLSYDEASGTLSLGARQGQYKGMVARRVFRIRFLKPGQAATTEFDSYDAEITYAGQPVRVRRE